MTIEELAQLRSLDLSTLENAGVYVRDDGQVALPYPNLTGIWYEQLHNPGGKPKYWNPPGAGKHLYNPAHVGPNEPEVWLCEGVFDTLTLIEAGLPAVGVPGTDFKGHWALLFEEADVVLAFDPDDAGQAFAERLLDSGLFQFPHLFTWPFEVEDWNQWGNDDRPDMLEQINEFRARNRIGQ